MTAWSICRARSSIQSFVTSAQFHAEFIPEKSTSFFLRRSCNARCSTAAAKLHQQCWSDFIAFTQAFSN
jgi:hypothetical protein